MTYLIDTNVLVYPLDGRDPDKGKQASAWLRLLAEEEMGALSTQALSELANVCLSRLRPRWTALEVSRHLEELGKVMEVLPLTPMVVREALRGTQEHRLSFYDAQMWAAARLYQVPYLLTEDMAAGSTIDGVTIVNPFHVRPPG